MKLKLNSFGKGNASALLVTIFVIVVLTISIGGYMTYVTQQARFSARSQAWNMSMAVAEAGIEEGFEHLNDNTNSLGSDGWSSTSAGVYTLTRSLNGTFNATYAVTIIFTNPFNPSIFATATVTPPAIAQNKSPFFYAAATGNQSINTSTTPSTVARAVSVTLYKPTFFNAAMVARGSIDLHGNNVTVDSFDSGIAGQNVNGLWAPWPVAGDKGTVASVGGISNSVNIGNADIYGPLYTSPGENYGVGANGAVGTHAWQAANGSGIESGYYHDDADFTFPSTLAPYSSGLTPPSNSVVTAIGNITNSQAFNNSLTPPPVTLPSGETMSALSTNTSIVTVSTYPGAQSGMTSNSTVVTTSTYPGSGVGLVTTNCNGFTTTTSDPGAQPCETSSSYMTNVASIPNPSPSGFSTNSSPTTSGSPPAGGSYIGNVTTNMSKNGKSITGYSYNAVTGYSYPVTVYQYANQFTYSYLSYAWTYSTKTYTYTIYTVAPTYSTNSYDAVLSGDGSTYYASALGNTIVTGNNVTLVMPNGYNIANLTIAPGASVNMYVGGTTISVDGNKVINDPGVAGSLIIYCAPSVTSFSLSGNGAMAAVIVAPNANVSLNGGGNNTIDFSGAIMANNITLNGHFNVHYDAALGRIPAPGRYILKSWAEVPVTH